MQERNERKRRRVKKVTISMRRCFAAFFILVIVAFFALVGIIWHLNKTDGERYTKQMLGQQTYVSNAIEYKRGDITDRNGTVLATSVKEYNLVIAPKTILSKDSYVEPTLRTICEVFPEMKQKELEQILEEKPESQYVVLLKEIGYDQKKEFEDVARENDYVKGYWFEEEYKRVYPYNSLACNVIGFANKGNTADAGIEGYYNDQMNGTNGREYGYFDSDLNLQKTIKAATDGNNLVSTIDVNIQQIVEKRVEQFNKEYGAKNVGVIVMNPKNGEIYAMSTGNFYDLNNPRDLTKYYPGWKKMTEEEKSDTLNKVWRNFCICDAFEPGSTFKTMTVSAALEEAKVNQNTTLVCDGGETLAGRRIKCMSHHGNITLGQSLMYSCNDALMQMGAMLQRDKFAEYEDLFNFGYKTGIDLPGETTGYAFSEEQLNVQELATSSFGQGITVSMIQIAAATASIINGGYYYQPHVVKQIISPNGSVVENIGPTLIRKTVSEKTSKLIREYLYETVENGTGAFCQIPGYKIGGKTGTAEKIPRGNDKYVVSFLGFAPADDPEVMVYVVVDEPNAEEQDHSYYATYMVHDILEQIMPFLNIYPDQEKLKNDTEQTTVPETTQPDNTDDTQEPTEGTESPESTQSPEDTDPTGDDDQNGGQQQPAFNPETDMAHEGGYFEEDEDEEGQDGETEPSTEEPAEDGTGDGDGNVPQP